jgi:hypothetical protein
MYFQLLILTGWDNGFFELTKTLNACGLITSKDVLLQFWKFGIGYNGLVCHFVDSGSV